MNRMLPKLPWALLVGVCALVVVVILNHLLVARPGRLFLVAAVLVGIAVGWAVWVILFAREADQYRYKWLKEIAIPTSLQLSLAIVGAAWALVSQLNEHQASANQKKAELLREIVASHDRPDIAYLSAVGDGFVLHLRRYDRITEILKTNSIQNQSLTNSQVFEEYACYFFYGLFREGFTEFHAVKGYELYPRLWMEEVFFKLVGNIITNVLGTSVLDPSLSAQEEPALYKYFRPAFSTTTEHQGNASDSPALFNFYMLLSKHIYPKDMETDGSYREMTAELRNGFARFQNRLTNSTNTMNIAEIYAAFDALVGIDDYAFNALFADWYSYGARGAPLGEEGELPPELTERLNPPRDFLLYPRSNFEGNPLQWTDERSNSWQLVRRLVADEFKHREE